MKNFTIERSLPRVVSNALFGDRSRFGPTPDPNDASWIEWQERSMQFYHATQRQGIGTLVNRAGYRIMRKVDLSGKKVLEIGPASLQHAEFWNGRPSLFTAVDVNGGYLDLARSRLAELGVRFDTVLLESSAAPLPIADAMYDIVVSFYSLEHIYPLMPQLLEIARILRPGGSLVGAIPCEGGVAWGAGRYLTSRRWLRANTSIDPSRIVCWEHPNFASAILAGLDEVFHVRKISYWPVRLPAIDLNLIAQFVCNKR